MGGGFSIIDFLNIPDNASVGFILEVNFEHPEQLHDSHKDLPLCSEHFIPPNSKCKMSKLMTIILPKKNYIVHYRNFKLYLSLGVKLTIIHRVLKFDQKPWLKSYIDLNTESRMKSVIDVICYCREEHAVCCKIIHTNVIHVRHTVDEHLKHPYPLSNVVKPSSQSRNFCDAIGAQSYRCELFCCCLQGRC